MHVRTQTQRMLEYDADPDQPGRPLMVLLGGAALALLALAFIIMVAYRTWILDENSQERAYTAISLLFGVHTVGVFLFAYGYELYDIGKALRLTIVIALGSVFAIAAVIGAMALLTRTKEVVSTASAFVDGAQEEGELRMAGGFFPAPGIPTTLGRFERPVEPAPPFAITCIGCGRDFQPSPPSAVCPYCGRENVKAG